jgi:hypothetical protein
MVSVYCTTFPPGPLACDIGIPTTQKRSLGSKHVPFYGAPITCIGLLTTVMRRTIQQGSLRGVNDKRKGDMVKVNSQEFIIASRQV